MTHVAVLSFLWHPLGYCPHGVGYNGCRSYGFWSGISGSFLSSLPGWIVALVIYTRHANCHAKGCWRLGRHPVGGTPYRTCRRHHPTVPEEITVEHIHAEHRNAQEGP